MTHHEKIDEELNFELMRSFLKAGNVILIVTSGSHEESLFHENKDSSRLWNLLGEYKNQVIGFPAFCSGITLDDIRIPIGNSGIHKKDMVKPLVQMFIDRGYDINQVFCIGDDALDLDMIVETSHLLNGIAYHIRKTDQCQCNREQISHFTEEDWKYIDDHGIGSFSDFMEQIVLPNLNIEKLNDKIKVWK